MAALKFFSVAISPLKGSLCIIYLQALLSESVLLRVINRVFSHLEIKKSSSDAKAQESIS